MKPYRLLLLLLPLLAAGCRKNDTPENASLSVRNNLPSPVQVHLYGNNEDKAMDRNRLASATINPSQTWAIPLAQLLPHQAIYWDWYTDDFLKTNWSPFDSVAAFRYAQSGSSFSGITGTTIENQLPKMGRKVLLNGNEIQTRWTAVSAYGQPLPAGQHYELMFHRRGTFTFDNNGTVLNGFFGLYDNGASGQPSMTINLFDNWQSGSGMGTLTQRTYSFGTSGYPSYGSDSLLGNLISAPELMFVRNP